MKNILSRLLFACIFTIVLSSCDMGIESGEDLVGEWVCTQYNLSGNITHTYTFNSNGTVKYHHLADSGYSYYSYYKYSIVTDKGYKIIKLLDYPDDSYSSPVGNTEDHEYYFSTDKKYLYMRWKRLLFNQYKKK